MYEREQGPCPIDTRGRFGIVALGHLTHGDTDGGKCEEWVDEKDGLPSHVVDDPAAQQRTDSGSIVEKPAQVPMALPRSASGNDAPIIASEHGMRSSMKQPR